MSLYLGLLEAIGVIIMYMFHNGTGSSMFDKDLCGKIHYLNRHKGNLKLRVSIEFRFNIKSVV